ncbi:MAG TPA: PINc/VapC family ATPase [Candidatus Norongarragalinales archaeon]|jgi:ATPase|nr:PINc/VapC family ATPase [Candidatus Norongarragalinales archaeon]
MKELVIVPDTGVLIDGRITERLAREKEKVRVIVPQVVVAELEYQANIGRETGFTGLDELKKLADMSKEKKISLEFAGERPTSQEIERAKHGALDANIRAIAKKFDAELLTTDKVQQKVAQAEGMRVEYLEPIVTQPKLSFAKYFTPQTLSVHLKDGLKPRAKIGMPGAFELKEIEDRESNAEEIEQMTKEAIEYSKRNPRSFIELDKRGATVLQIGNYRVTFTKPPLSEAMELTIVRPIAKLTLSDYKLSPKLYDRIARKAEGILIAGRPGSGKSTFATALADHYAEQHKIVKTLEQPRDLQVSKLITQYAPLEGSFYNTADILLLVRPDYTIYDEVRKPEDFKIFTDLRLAGIGLVGVVHASGAIDAIQRFIGKIDLGVIPQVIDTITFIHAGHVAKVLDLSFVVKVPYGMREADLARPVIEVRDFETQQIEYEIYKFGEETVVFPVKNAKAKGQERLAGPAIQINEGKIRGLLSRFLDRYEIKLEGDNLTVYAPERDIGKLVGHKGKTIQVLEKKLGVHIDARPL